MILVGIVLCVIYISPGPCGKLDLLLFKFLNCSLYPSQLTVGISPFVLLKSFLFLVLSNCSTRVHHVGYVVVVVIAELVVIFGMFTLVLWNRLSRDQNACYRWVESIKMQSLDESCLPNC